MSAPPLQPQTQHVARYALRNASTLVVVVVAAQADGSVALFFCSDDAHLARRGATFLLDADGSTLYEHRDTGVLTYSATMPRPLSFLEPYIGDRALNPQAFEKRR